MSDAQGLLSRASDLWDRRPAFVDMADHIGNNISTVCDKVVGDKTLHCAHWVSHVLGVPSGDCSANDRRAWKLAEAGPNPVAFDPDVHAGDRRWYMAFVVRWHPDMGSSPPATISGGKLRLGFAGTQAHHVGFYSNGYFYHYENDSSFEKVVKVAYDNTAPGPRFRNRYMRKGYKTSPVYLTDLPQTARTYLLYDTSHGEQCSGGYGRKG